MRGLEGLAAADNALNWQADEGRVSCFYRSMNSAFLVVMMMLAMEVFGVCKGNFFFGPDEAWATSV